MLVRFVFRYLIKGIRTRALRKRHSASFLAAARRFLQSIKIADQGCFAKDKNESLFLRHKNPTNFVGFFVVSEGGFLRNKIRGPRGILCTRGEKEHTSKRVSIIAPDNAILKEKCATCARGYAAEPPITGLTASEERSKRLHLRKSSAADIANNRTRSVKCRALARKRGC